MISKTFASENITYEIRTITPSDIPGLLRLKNDTALHEERILQQADGVAHYLGAYVRQNAVGFVVVYFANKLDVLPYTDNEWCADMVDLYVAESYRNRGIGSSLITVSELLCRNRRIPFMGLDVNPTDNAKAMELYRSLGYQAVGELHLDGIYDYLDENGIRRKYEDWCVDMVKRVD